MRTPRLLTVLLRFEVGQSLRIIVSLLLVTTWPSPTYAVLGGGGTLAGYAEVVDGDTLSIGGEAVRMFGIDAPELEQSCGREGAEPMPCGELAAEALRQHIRNRHVSCEIIGFDRVALPIARCRVIGRDLAAAVVRDGWALAYRRYTDSYVPQQEAARRARAGIWATSFEPPWVWRLSQATTGDGGEIFLDTLADGHGLVISEDFSGEDYKEGLQIAYLWANVLLLVVATGGFYLTLRQIRIGTDQTRATVLADLYNRIQSNEFSTMVDVFSKFIEEVGKRHDGALEEAYRSELMALHDQRAGSYSKMMRLCWFLEMIGYNVRERYIRFDDVYELMGGFILPCARVFKPHILDLRVRSNDAKLYEHATNLFDAVARRHASTPGATLKT